MNPVSELQLYKNDDLAVAPWAQLRVSIDAKLPSLAVALVAQRAVMTAISVLNTTTQPTAPLVWPVMLWLVLTVRKLLAAVVSAGACAGSPSLLVDCGAVSAYETPLTLLARFLAGLQQALFVRYPFAVIGGDTKINGIALVSPNMLVVSSSSGRGQPLCGGRVRFCDGPGMNNYFILASLVHPHVSPIAQFYDGGQLLGRATAAAEELFAALYPSKLVAGPAGAKVKKDPLGAPLLLPVSTTGDVPALLRAAVGDLRVASDTRLTKAFGADRFAVDPYVWMQTEGLSAKHTILAASQIATYCIPATAADAERSHSEAGRHWSDDRRGLGVKAGSDGTVIAQYNRREALNKAPAPVLSSIACVPQILHELQSILTEEEETTDGDTVFVPVYPGLPTPPSRKLTAAELRITAELGTLAEALPGLAAVIHNIDFSDVELAESVDADAASAALAAGALVALPDGQLATVEAESDSDTDEPSEDFGGDADTPDVTTAIAVPTVLGREGNRSMRIAVRGLRALEAEQTSELLRGIAEETKIRADAAASSDGASPADASPTIASEAGKKRSRRDDKASGDAACATTSSRGRGGGGTSQAERRGRGRRVPSESRRRRMHPLAPGNMGMEEEEGEEEEEEEGEEGEGRGR
jgi:hypothetical protein